MRVIVLKMGAGVWRSGGGQHRPPLRSLAMTDPRDGGAAEALEALYEALPEMRCGGKCWDSCGPIGMSTLERRVIKEKTGQEIPRGIVYNSSLATTCPQLTFLKRCRIYEHRPLICRLWGLVETLKCPYGCVPEGGHLSEEEGWVLINRVLALSGQASFSEDEIRQRTRSGQLRHWVRVVEQLNDLGLNPLSGPGVES